MSDTGTHLKIRKDVSPTVTHFFSLYEKHHMLRYEVYKIIKQAWQNEMCEITSD